MKTKAVLILVFLLFTGLVCLANDGVPVAISPGSNLGVGSVENRCPAFSWSGVAWAEKYRVVVFGVEDATAKIDGEMNLTAKPLLAEDIAGGGLSWTPSLNQGLPGGKDYVWYVGAMDAGGAWAWSASRRFRVEESGKLALSEEDSSGSKQPLSKDKANDETSLRAAAALPAGKATGKADPVNDPVVPMGSEGTYSTFYGNNAGANNSGDGNGNSFFGSYSGYTNTDGAANVFMGYQAGYYNTDGSFNTFIGNSAGYSNTTGSDNIFMGYNTGNHNTSGYENTFMGNGAGHSNTTGWCNTFMGTSAGFSSSTGYANSFMGSGAGFENTTGSDNTFVGFQAGGDNTTGRFNTFMGCLTGPFNTTGNYNTFIGEETGYYNTTGNDNTFIGFQAGCDNTTGHSNSFLGFRAGYANTTGNFNTFVGNSAGYLNSIGSSNVFLGYNAGYNETGSNKLYIDNSDTASPLIFGDFSTDKVGINGWLGVGTQAPAYPMELKTSGINAAFVANRSGGAVNYINATDTFGNFGTVNNFPLRLTVNAAWKLRLNADNSLMMANGASCTAGGVWTNASSLTLKENITTLTGDEAATTLQSLNPVKYNYKADKGEKYVGFIAEEVPDLVAMNDRKALSPMDIVAVLTKVVQEQQKVVQEQKEIVREQQKTLSEQKTFNLEQQKSISALQNKVSYLENKLSTEK